MKKTYNIPSTNVSVVCAHSYMCIPSISTQVDPGIGIPVPDRLPGPHYE